uniref:NADH-ubiquinone oxidoreductase chain 2 n=1 Tax=Aneides flavipunctatus TaxID=154579 RepID=Q645D5_9SALA|nr:NADH dehydrogenase subunit 2 [Aneides flavipunctatus]AAU20449.1 NADH dehydrogenase subunit 2 [Aneides flavipunctatus]
MNPYVLSVLLSSLSAGTIITLVSNHWFLAWMGLELNTLAIVPLMSKMHHPRATEAATKYFLVQAVASALILFATMLNAWYTGEWTIINMQMNIPTLLLTLALLIKLAVAPFHMWMPDVMQGLSLIICLILSTWQKLAPMALLILIAPKTNPMLLTLLGTLSLLVGGWGGLNQLQLRKIMAYSSIAHLGWMIIILSFMPNLTLFNLLIYILMTMTMFLIMMNFSSTNTGKMTSSWMKNLTLTSMMMMILMSLGGLPPTSGFLPKWMILEEIIKQNLIPLATAAAISALLSLFFYLRLSYMMSLTTPPTPLNSKIMWRLNMIPNQILAMMIVTSTLLLPITPSILNFM